MAKKILIVEDERLIAEDIKLSLHQFGYEVTSIVAFGEDVVNAAREVRPDLALVDIKLRGDTTGLTAAQELFEEMGTPIVFLTANANLNTIRQAAQSSPYGYLIKPFQERELQATIELALYKHEMTQFLKDREHLLHSVIDTDPNMIYVKDRHGRFAVVNKSFAGIFNMTPEEMMGKTLDHLTDENRIHAALVERLHEEEKYVFTTGERVHISEEGLKINGGGMRWFQRTVVPLNLDIVDSGVLGVWVEITDLKKTEQQLEASYAQLKTVMEQTVNGFVSAVEMRDPYTAGHQRRVSQLAVTLGQRMGLDDSSLEAVRMAALLHDIGKIYIPAEILNKPQHLLEEEYDLVKLHPQIGYNTLSKIDFAVPIARIVLQHHEKVDGTGYPKGITGEDILQEARIISLADFVEAMVSNRPYREARSMGYVVKELQQLRGKHFDPEVVDVFVSLVDSGGFDFQAFIDESKR
jgi:PAS domain S-box-containing protein/putative nucleotidyltransferase with HDIG domain